jgi:cell division control protein 7
LTIPQIRCYIKSLLTSLRHLHDLGILHRDIKPPNFLFDPIRGDARLVDFGLSEELKTDFDIPNDIDQSNRFACTCTNYQGIIFDCSISRMRSGQISIF